jgi:hypothetical protein
MNEIYNDPTLINGRKHKQFYSGFLLKAGNGQIIKTPFQYSINTSRQYNVATSVMPTEYIVPAEIIRTSRLDLPFAKDDKVCLCDGRIMTIKTAVQDINDNRAMMDGKGIIAWIITLEGGGK